MAYVLLQCTYILTKEYQKIICATPSYKPISEKQITMTFIVQQRHQYDVFVLKIIIIKLECKCKTYSSQNQQNFVKLTHNLKNHYLDMHIIRDFVT